MTVAVRLGLVIDIAVAKVGKYATSESGDSVEVVERPLGGLSVVMADGQRSGKGAKAISNMVVRKALSLLADGVRDGAAARAAHDYLRAQRGGKVSATLNLVSLDLVSQTLVLSRNSHCPVLLFNPRWIGQISPDGWLYLNEPSEAIGIHSRTRPVVTELHLEAGTSLLVFTDGIWTAGERKGQRISIPGLAAPYLASASVSAAELADELLARAVALDDGRPTDDMSLVVMHIASNRDGLEARRMLVSVPI